MKKIFSRLGDLLWILIEIPAGYIFGRDIFVSYSRRDGNVYATNLILELQKQKPKLSVYLDKWMASSEGKLPFSLKLQIRLSSMLVLVCTPFASQSKSVRKELQIFAKKGRKIVIINAGDSFKNYSDEEYLWPLISGNFPETETTEGIKDGTPSANVMDRILKSLNFTIQDRRLRRSVWATVVFLALSIGGTVLYSTVTIRKANAEAGKQRAIGSVRRMVNESAFMLGQSDDSIIKSTRMLIEATGICDSVGEHILEADKALRSNLNLLPVLLSSGKLEGADVFSSNLKYTATKINTGKDTDTIKIRQSGNNKVIANIACRNNEILVALSDDANRLVLVTEKEEETIFKIKEINGKGEWNITPYDEEVSQYDAEISPDGKYLLISYWDNHRTERAVGGDILIMAAGLWEIETQRSVELDTDGYMNISSVSFSPNGKKIILGGLGFDYRGSGEAGKVLVWDFEPKQGKLDANALSGRRSLEQLDIVILAAVSDDGYHLATYTDKQTVFGWKETGDNKFLKISCIPYNEQLTHLRFNSNKEISLVTRSSAGKSNDHSLTLSRWEINSYPGIRIGYSNPIMDFSFQKNDNSIATLVQSYELSGSFDKRLGKWRINDKTQVTGEFFIFEGLGRFVLSKYNDTVDVWDLQLGKKLQLPVEQGFETLGDPFFSTNGSYMSRVARMEDSSLLMIYKREGQQYIKIKSREISFHPTNTIIYIADTFNRLIVSEIDEGIRIYDLTNGKDITPGELQAIKRANSFSTSDDQHYIAIESQDGYEDEDERGDHFLYLWDLEKMKLIKKLTTAAWISSYKFSPQSKYLLIGDKGGSLHNWNIQTLVEDVTEHTYPVIALSFSPDERYMATGLDNGLVKIIDLKKQIEISHLVYSARIDQIRFSPGNEYIAVATDNTWFGEPDEGSYFLFISPLQLKDLKKIALDRIRPFIKN